MPKNDTAAVSERTVFAERLVQAMGDDGRTVQRFADDIGLTKRTLVRWRTGVTEPSGRDLVRLSAALGIAPEWFYGEDL